MYLFLSLSRSSFILKTIRSQILFIQRDGFVISRLLYIPHSSEMVNPLGNVQGVCRAGCRVHVHVCVCVVGGLTLRYVTVSSAPLKLWTVTGTCCCFTLLLDDRGYLLHSMYSVCVCVCE